MVYTGFKFLERSVVFPLVPSADIRTVTRRTSPSRLWPSWDMDTAGFAGTALSFASTRTATTRHDAPCSSARTARPACDVGWGHRISVASCCGP